MEMEVITMSFPQNIKYNKIVKLNENIKERVKKTEIVSLRENRLSQILVSFLKVYGAKVD